MPLARVKIRASGRPGHPLLGQDVGVYIVDADGRVLARDEAGALKLGGEFWPKVKEFTVRTAEEEDDPFS